MRGFTNRPENPGVLSVPHRAGAGKEEYMKRLSIKQVKKEEAISSVNEKLSAVAPEYHFELYKQILAERRRKRTTKGSPMLPGSFENGKRK